MRVILVLTALAVIAILVGAGHTEKAQETATAVQLVRQYDAQTRRISNIERRVFCKGTKAYLVKKRLATWKWQDASYVTRTPTSYSERRTECSAYLKWLSQLWAGRAHKAFKKHAQLQDPVAAICHIFGRYCSQALAVSRCESGQSHSVRAQNGQYLGMFQMGNYARSAYGHGYTPLEQAYAAYRYFVASGRDWSPWSCKPY